MHAGMHVTNKKSGNMTRLHDKNLLTSLYTKKASNLSKQADFVDIHMNKTTYWTCSNAPIIQFIVLFTSLQKMIVL